MIALTSPPVMVKAAALPSVCVCVCVCRGLPLEHSGRLAWGYMPVWQVSAYRFLRRQVRWSSIPISKNFPVCCDPRSQRLRCSQ